IFPSQVSGAPRHERGRNRGVYTLVNTVANQPAAVSPQPTDLVLGWQAAQSPSTRKFTLQQIGAGISLPLAGGTLTGKLTITLGGIEVTGAATFHSPVSLQAITATTGAFSGALVATTGTFSGAIT